LRQLRGLKSYRANGDPTPRSVKAHPDVRKITKQQCDDRQRKPQPPCALPKVIISQRANDADRETNSEPNRLPSDEKIDVSMAVARKRTRAKKHDDPDNEKSQDGEKKDISALTMHNQVERACCFVWRTSFFFSLGFGAFPFVVFGFVALGINSFWPIRNLCASWIWLSAIRSS